MLDSAFTVDVEDWFHILDAKAVPAIDQWAGLESRVEYNMSRILDLMASCAIKGTFFWLGWIAERHKSLVRRCSDEGHEIASHGYAHLIPWVAGEQSFRADIVRAKEVLEDSGGAEVPGFRAPGFGIKNTTDWAFDVIKEAGYSYDASVFPARRSHGGIVNGPLLPTTIETRYGSLVEVPMSVVRFFGQNVCLFGGGYLRIVPKAFFRWGAAQLEARGRPLVTYLHPRDIDPDQPRLSLPPIRYFKAYAGLEGTYEKLKRLCLSYRFDTVRSLVDQYIAHGGKAAESRAVPSKATPATQITSIGSKQRQRRVDAASDFRSGRG